MIKQIELKFGSTENQTPLSIDVSPITIFVGPNNSGKSKLLSEINSWCCGGISDPSNLILGDLTFSQIEDPAAELERFTLKPSSKESIPPSYVIVGRGPIRRAIEPQVFLSALSVTTSNPAWFGHNYVSLQTLLIDGAGRITLVNPQSAGDLQEAPEGSFAVLFKDPVKRKEVRRIIYDAFKTYFVIDPTLSGHFRIRFSDHEPTDENQECGLSPAAIEFHGKAKLVDKVSDGMKAFTGIITTIIAGDPRIILIDEPEAFLHPSLSSSLGKEIGKAISNGAKNLFVATHSSAFLMGCIQSGVPVNIVRVTYSNNAPTARLLPSDDVLKLMRHPLLRSTGVLNGLFYEYVIVTEGDSDRALYQEINERLLSLDPPEGISNCLFVNAQNKQTIHEIIRPLRKMGIPCVGIVDIDVIKEGGVVWTNLLSSANLPSIIIDSTAQARSVIKLHFDLTKIDYKKNGGINVLDTETKTACNDLFDRLDEYGIFVVRNGELESWLKDLGIVSGHGPSWLIKIFEKMGENPFHTDYVKPTQEDIWAFLRKINGWFTNPGRKGLPN